MRGRSVDVCIIGAGLVGCFAALFLRQRGRSVAIIEKGMPGREASGVNYGNLRLQGRNPAEYPLSLLAHGLWESFERLIGETCGFDNCGHAYLALAEGEEARLERSAREAGAGGLTVELLSAAETRRRWPVLADSVRGACWSARDAVAEPQLAGVAAARAAARAGADLREGVRASGIARTGAGYRVATEGGAAIECAQVVNAAGAWAGVVAGWLGEPVPMFAAGPPIIATEPQSPLGLASMQAVDGSIIFRQRAGGEVITSSFPRQASSLVDGPAPITPERIARDLKTLAAVVPVLKGAQPNQAWSGVEGYLPDLLPVIGPSVTTPGVTHAFGLSGHGFQLAPGVGRVVADLVTEGRSDVPIAAFAIARWAGEVAPDERLAREFEPELVRRVVPS